MSVSSVTPAPQLRLTATLIRRHQRGVWRYLRLLGCDQARADDLTQDTFLQLLRHPPDRDDDAALSRWLRTTAFRLFVNSGRRPRPGVTMEHAELEIAWQRFARRNDGDEYLDALALCLDALPDAQRRAVELRYRDDASRSQVAAALGISSEGAKTTMRRALARLLACIDRRTSTEP